MTRLQRSLYLRPAGLLPSLSKAFDTPLGPSDLSFELESATGLFGAYPERTFTCENNASFSTHHDTQSIAGRGDAFEISFDILVTAAVLSLHSRTFQRSEAPRLTRRVR